MTPGQRAAALVDPVTNQNTVIVAAKWLADEITKAIAEEAEKNIGKIAALTSCNRALMEMLAEREKLLQPMMTKDLTVEAAADAIAEEYALFEGHVISSHKARRLARRAIEVFIDFRPRNHFDGEIAGERDARRKCEDALRRKDEAMGILFERLRAAGVDCSDLIS